MDRKAFPVADLSDEILNKVKTMESELRRQTADDLILIAYKNTDRSMGGDNHNG